MRQFLQLSVMILLVACSDAGGRGGVWSDYDYLSTVPDGAGVDVDTSDRELRYYRQTEDNDDTYVIPYQYEVCSPGYDGVDCQ